jgi:hypothetical protein
LVKQRAAPGTRPTPNNIVPPDDKITKQSLFQRAVPFSIVIVPGNPCLPARYHSKWHGGSIAALSNYAAPK